VSGGGVTYPWNSPLVIVLLILGCLLFILFVVYEAKFAKIPIMPSTPPPDIVDNSASLHNPFSGINPRTDFPCGSSLLRQSILPPHILPSPTTSKYNWLRCPSPPTYNDSNIYRNISWFNPRKVNPLQAISHRTGRYNPVICTGFALWTLGLGLQTTFSADISTAKIIGYLIVEGFGIGLTFQTSMLTLSITDNSIGSSPSNLPQKGPCSGYWRTKFHEDFWWSIRSC
jgi:hypothetical protein